MEYPLTPPVAGIVSAWLNAIMLGTESADELVHALEPATHRIVDTLGDTATWPIWSAITRASSSSRVHCSLRLPVPGDMRGIPGTLGATSLSSGSAIVASGDSSCILVPHMGIGTVLWQVHPVADIAPVFDLAAARRHFKEQVLLQEGELSALTLGRDLEAREIIASIESAWADMPLPRGVDRGQLIVAGCIHASAALGLQRMGHVSTSADISTRSRALQEIERASRHYVEALFSHQPR